MKITSTATQSVWKSGDYVGNDRRPTHRVTISNLTASHPQYRYDRSQSWIHAGWFQSLLFGQAQNRPRELHNVQSVKWARGVDTDVATCSIVLANVEVRNDLDPESDAELDFPGYYTPNRGTEDYFSRWGYVSNEWKNWIIPDRIIRTYEGYGINPLVCAEKDEHLYPSGVWKIDDVTLDANSGTITLDCRDIGSVLLDQVMVAPAIPWGTYPLSFDVFENRGKAEKVATSSGAWQRPTYQADSNLYYRGSGLKDGDGTLLVEADGTVKGHHGRDAFDASTNTFWLSAGKKSPSRSDATDWVQGKIPPGSTVAGVRLDGALNNAQRVYISLQKNDGTWYGTKRVPYKAIDVNTQANVPYVHSFVLKMGETANVKLPKAYSGVKAIRYSFSQYKWSGIGYDHIYRGAVASLYWSPSVHMVSQAGTFKTGNYGDYTDIIKWLLAWAGWYWPGADYALGTQTLSDGTTRNVVPAKNDATIPNGAIWGDFEMSGTKGIATLDVSTFDQKPFMDGIAAVREILGFDFWIDETGGAVWRLPNVFKKGNFVMPDGGGARTAHTTSVIEIDERQTLSALSVKLSAKNVRERVYVGNASGNHGAVVSGYSPDVTGLRRFAGWTDQHFATDAECERMADLIAMRQMFLYRQNTLTIAANPAIQPDDQIIIYERSTGEGYVHRVLNISSDWDAATGKWTYDLTTNWLGNKAFTKLAFDPAKLRNETIFYIKQMGRW
jgi:hypothetical protein